MANAIAFDTELLDTIVITERHGGLTQTAYALLGDLVAVRRAIGPARTPDRRSH
jgi:homoserine dehydrogenase